MNARAFAATIAAELKLRLGNTGSITRLAALVILCAMLVPPAGSSYIVLAIDAKRPEMSADTALLAASLVLATLIIPIYGLWLDLGRTRDAALGTRTLIATAPAPLLTILLARLCAQGVAALLSICTALFILTLTLVARFAAPPGAAALLLCLGITGLAGVFATVLGALAELVGGRSTVLRVGVIFCAWLAVIMLAVTGTADFIGVGAIRQMIGDPAAAARLSFGFVSSPNAVYRWQHYAAPVHGVLVAMTPLLILIMAAGFVTVALASFAPRHGAARSIAASVAPMSVPLPMPRPIDAYSARPPVAAQPRFATTSAAMARRLLRKSRSGGIVLLAGFVMGWIGSIPPGVALLLVYAFPFFVTSSVSAAEMRMLVTVERVEPAFLRFGNGLAYAATLAGMMLAAAGPALIRAPALQAATAVTGICTLVLWLVLVCRQLDRALAGVAAGLLAIYLIGFNPIPASADLLGLWHADAGAFAASAALVAVLGIALVHIARR